MGEGIKIISHLKAIAYVKTGLIIFFLTIGLAFTLYFGLTAILKHSPILVPIGHITDYLGQSPVLYLASIAGVFALVSTTWITLVFPKFQRFRLLQIMTLPFVVLFVSGPVWGIIYIYHDMQAGYFPVFSQMVEYLWFGVTQGLFIAPIAAISSFPLNVISYTLAYIVLYMISQPVASSSKAITTDE